MMDEIVIFEHTELTRLHAELSRVVDGIDTGAVYRVRVCVDEGTFKVKTNEHTWSPPLGERE